MKFLQCLGQDTTLSLMKFLKCSGQLTIYLSCPRLISSYSHNEYEIVFLNSKLSNFHFSNEERCQLLDSCNSMNISCYKMSDNTIQLKLESHTQALEESLKSVKDFPELADVTLISDEEVFFKAHKLILSIFSPVIRSFIGLSLEGNTVIQSYI